MRSDIIGSQIFIGPYLDGYWCSRKHGSKNAPKAPLANHCQVVETTCGTAVHPTRSCHFAPMCSSSWRRPAQISAGMLNDNHTDLAEAISEAAWAA